MKKTAFLHIFLITVAGLITPMAAGDVLLIDPSNESGVSTALTGSTPYTVDAGSSWNQGGVTYPSTLVYADGSNATGVSAVADATSSFSSWTVDFSNPALNTLGGTGSGVFADDPAEDAIYAAISSNGSGFIGMKVTDLAFGVYDIYVAAAYIGGTSATRPGGSSPSQQAVWIFSGTASDTLTYDPGTGHVSGAGASGLAASEVLENSIIDSWTENDNFERLQVTLDASNPTLYIAASGDDFYNENTGDQRPWLNLVQVVSVPEPSSLALTLIAGLLGVAAARRRYRA